MDDISNQHKYPEIFVDSLFILEAEKIAKQSSENLIKSSIFTVEIRNLALIKIMYGQDFFEQTMDNIIVYLKKLYSSDALISRTSSAHLCVYFSNCNRANANEKGAELLKQFQNFQNPSKPIHLDVVIISLTLPDDETDIKESIHKSFLALRNIKNNDQTFYQSYADYHEHTGKIKDNFQSALIFKKAILEQKIQFAYQPIVNSKTRKTEYYECLLRMKTDEDLLISAGPYIPLAEQMNFISMIDEKVLDFAYEDLVANPNLRLSLNISGADLDDQAWLKMAKLYFKDPQISSRVMVEITETAMQKDVKTSQAFINLLHELGCKVALDDFGCGYTSFSQLKLLPVDTVKIDGIYIKDIMSNQDSRFFVETLCNMRASSNFKLVAEFVTNKEIADLLTEMGVEYLQGNYFGAADIKKPW